MAKAKKEPAEGGAKKSIPLPVVIGLAILLAGGGAFMAGKSAVAKGGEKEGTRSEKSVEGPLESVPLEEFLVNLKGGSHYLKIAIALGYDPKGSKIAGKPLSAKAFEPLVPPVRDAVNTVLLSKTLTDLNQDTAKEGLREELRRKVNQALGAEPEGGPIRKVYILSFATQ